MTIARAQMGKQLKGNKMKTANKYSKVKKMKSGGGTKKRKTPPTKKNRLKQVGSMTMIPYALKAAGYDDLANATGYPLNSDGSMRPEVEIEANKKRRSRPYGQGAVDAISNTYRKVREATGMKSGGQVKKMASGGKMNRGDGCCTKGKTKGRMI